MFVSLMDKLVWILLITVITTQGLQYAGVVDAPTHGELKDRIHTFQISIGDDDVRGKRQVVGDRSPLLDNIFNIPIATLNAVNDLVQNTRPVVQRLRDNAQRRLEAAAAASDAGASSSRQQRGPTNAELKAGPRDFTRRRPKSLCTTAY